MILHTILALEEVLYDKRADRPRRYIRCPEGLIEIGEGNTINRMISTDPSVFLQSEFAPGMPLPKQQASLDICTMVGPPLSIY